MSTLLGVPRLLLPATYAPPAGTTLGIRGRPGTCTCGATFQHYPIKGPLPKLGPCCKPAPAPKESPAVKAVRRSAERSRYTAAELVHRISQPGWAVVAFDGGVTLFTRQGHHQARTLAEAMGQADDAGATP